MNLGGKLSYGVLFPLFLAGCVTVDDPKDYQPTATSTEVGKVCLYRTAPRGTPGVWQNWVMDGKWNGEIRPDRYYCMNTHVGRHIVRVGGTEAKLEFMIERNQELFIRFETDGSQKGKPFPIYPVLVDRQTAGLELKSKGYDSDRPNSGR